MINFLLWYKTILPRSQISLIKNILLNICLIQKKGEKTGIQFFLIKSQNFGSNPIGLRIYYTQITCLLYHLGTTFFTAQRVGEIEYLISFDVCPLCSTWEFFSSGTYAPWLDTPLVLMFFEKVKLYTRLNWKINIFVFLNSSERRFNYKKNHPPTTNDLFR